MGEGWVRSRWARGFTGLLVGAALGWLVHQGLQLTGPELFMLLGAAAGLVGGLLLHAYARSVRLTEITVTVPQFSELRFAVTRDGQQVAWKLFVETATRVSTQALGPGDGRMREALTSLYGLFAVTRELLKEAHPGVQTGPEPTVEQLGIAMLNLELRPFLSRWHPALRAWELAHPDTAESEWADDAACRAELAQVQRRLAAYVQSFGRLAGVARPEVLLGPAASEDAGRRSG
ncbi:hypothetical protein K7640_20495 [Micromonospora sp. PLK6-60]|uniref:hypothetical protein n=1 Tax=Micromonospora sp. PLK6-60 TaxID=2873383 RepID=UPI001CA74AE6|nr:hypothetical protein [Micromonospora sp. PLK6-60]MBY8874212.1 hypothetical protein [Micromonospora sp. PLK6-60]